MKNPKMRYRIVPDGHYRTIRIPLSKLQRPISKEGEAVLAAARAKLLREAGYLH